MWNGVMTTKRGVMDSGLTSTGEPMALHSMSEYESSSLGPSTSTQLSPAARSSRSRAKYLTWRLCASSLLTFQNTTHVSARSVSG